jgi:hypothetical protein
MTVTDSYWVQQFRDRMSRFGGRRDRQGEPISIKLRVSSGCFHCSCSPMSYRIIREELHRNFDHDVELVEHESGPELLVWVALGTAGISLTASLINLVTAIIRARSEGMKAGDRHYSEPVELIVRRVTEKGEVQEIKVRQFAPQDQVSREEMEEVLTSAVSKLLPAP